MGSHPTWIGDRGLFGYLHVPDQGAARAGVVVFGIGAAVLAEARAGEEPLDAVALWQPAVSGRRWVREQTALIGMGGGSPPAPLEPGELPGLVLPPAVRSDIERMKTRMG